MHGSVPRSMSARAAAVLLALLGGHAHADEPAPASGAPPAAPPVALTVPPAAGCPCIQGDGGTQFALDVLIGQQMGVRGQVAVNRQADSAWAIEGFYGALLTKLNSGEGAGLGLRYYWRRTNRDGCNSVLFGPGAGLFCVFDDETWMIAPTMEVAWVRAISDTGAWQLGLNGGVGVGLGDGKAGRVTPLISLFTGFRF